jgi:hypothetical protein
MIDGHVSRAAATVVVAGRPDEDLDDAVGRQLPPITVFSSDLITEIPHLGWA